MPDHSTGDFRPLSRFGLSDEFFGSRAARGRSNSGAKCRQFGADEKGRPVLLVKLAAPPVDGKANTELIRFLADELDCPKGQITLLRGTSGRQKSLELPAAALERLPK